MATVALHTIAPSRRHCHVHADHADARVSSSWFEDSFLLNREVAKWIRSSTTGPGTPTPQETEGDCHVSTDDRDYHLWPGTGRSAQQRRFAPGCAFCRGAL